MGNMNERLVALSGRNGALAAALVALKLAYEVIDALSNVDFVIQKVPAVGGLLNAIFETNILILLALLLIIAILLWPAELGPGGTQVRKMKALLKEAAELHAKYEDRPKKFSDDSVHEAALRSFKIFNFLEMGFRVGIRDELIAYRDREHEKHKAAGAAFDPDRATADYLAELRGRLKGTDLDKSFVMPHSYEQFYRADGWVPNSVAAKK